MRDSTRRQHGLPVVYGAQAGAHGTLLRGVVTATYVIDDPDHPYLHDQNIANGIPVAIYCDVLAYTMMPGSRNYFVPQCLVSQDVGGMQRGHIWKPRAATLDVTGNTYNPAVGTNPANLDGDHVLIGFMDDNFNQPVILRGLPHPSADIGHAGDVLGHRVKMVVADGDPDFVKHHGSYYGVTTTGDFIVDTTQATDGSLASDGSEPAPATDGSRGNHYYNIEQHAARLLQFMNMAAPTAPAAAMSELLAVAGYVLDFMTNTPGWQIKAGSNNAMQVQNAGTATTVAMGDGSAHVAIAEQLATLWGSLVTYLNTHVHPVTALGSPTGVPVAPAPSWSSSVQSTKISIPST